MKEAKTTQKYKRKTKDCYAIEGNCGCGWDIECYCEGLYRNIGNKNLHRWQQA